MSDLNPPATEKAGAPKKPTSPVRNIIGIIVLIGVIVFGVFEYSAKSGFNAAVNALQARTEDETQALMTIQEAEKILGKEADGPATEFKDGVWNFDKKTYTWPGVLKHYTLTAYYTKEKDSRLHHFETEGTKLALELGTKDAGLRKSSAQPASKGKSGKGGKAVESPPQPTIAPDSKSPPAAPTDKGSTDKTEPSAAPPPAAKPSAPSDKGTTTKPDAPAVPAKPS